MHDRQFVEIWLQRAAPHILHGVSRVGLLLAGRIESGWSDLPRQIRKPPDPTRPDPTRPDPIKNVRSKSLLTRTDPTCVFSLAGSWPMKNPYFLGEMLNFTGVNAQCVSHTSFTMNVRHGALLFVKTAVMFWRQLL